jgi:5-methylcytosine-specific restriction protein A
MSPRALTPCLTSGCPNLVRRGRCAQHQREHRGTTTALGYGAAWRRLRLLVLTEEPWCRECQKHGRRMLATEVDHITPRRLGGTNDRTNLQSLCSSHHSAKTAREQHGRASKWTW